MLVWLGFCLLCLFKESRQAFGKGGLICRLGEAVLGLGIVFGAEIIAHLLGERGDESGAHFRVVLAGPDVIADVKASV